MKQTHLFHTADEVEEHRHKLWEVCKYAYGKFGTFSDKTMTFHIPELEYERTQLKPGNYSLLPQSKRRGYKTLDQQSPIVQAALDCCRKLPNQSAILQIPAGIVPGTEGFLQVSLLKCRCHYEYEKLIQEKSCFQADFRMDSSLSRNEEDGRVARKASARRIRS